MGIVILLMVREIVCGMVEISVLFTLILAAVNVSVFLSTSINPPQWLAIDQRFWCSKSRKVIP